MLLKDKHTPKFLNDFIINKNVAQNILKFSDKNDLTNFIFTGVSGSGKFTLAKAYLAEIFGLDVYKTKRVSFKQKTKEIEILQSKYHYEINLNNYFLNDKQSFNNLITDLSGNINISTLSQNVFIIRNIDLLDKDTLCVFKKIIEKTFSSAIYLLITKNGSKTQILNCICNNIRVGFPSENEIIDFFKFKTLLPIKESENISIIKETKNLNFIFSKIEMTNLGVKKSKINKNVLEEHLDIILKLVYTLKPSNIIKIREEIYFIICKNFDKNMVFNYIVKKISSDDKLSTEIKIKIVNIASKYQHRMILAYREVIHLEAFLVNVMSILSST